MNDDVAKGRVRYLRPGYQNPEASGQKSEEQTELETTQIADSESRIPPAAKQPWPKTVAKQAAAEQAAAVRTIIRQTGWSSDEDIKPLAQHFKGVRAPKSKPSPKPSSPSGKRLERLNGLPL